MKRNTPDCGACEYETRLRVVSVVPVLRMSEFLQACPAFLVEENEKVRRNRVGRHRRQKLFCMSEVGLRALLGSDPWHVDDP